MRADHIGQRERAARVLPRGRDVEFRNGQHAQQISLEQRHVLAAHLVVQREYLRDSLDKLERRVGQRREVRSGTYRELIVVVVRKLCILI